MKQLVSDVFDELLALAKAQGCTFPADFKEKTMSDMLRTTDANSIMYQDYTAKRPMEVETYLGSPIKLAQLTGLAVPRIETLYAIMHNLNIVNQQRRDAGPGVGNPPPRLSSMPPPARAMVNGNGAPRGRGGRTSSMTGPPPGMRRGPPPMNGGPPNGYGRPMTGNGGGYTSRTQSRRGSMEGNDLEEFSHLVLYGDIPESGESTYGGDNTDTGFREREFMLRQRELALKEQEMRMRRPGGDGGARRGPGSVRNGGFDDDDDEDYFDPMDAPPAPMIDPDSFDMMSVTSRRNRRQPSASQLRKNPEADPPYGQRMSGRLMRPGYPRNRSSARVVSQVPNIRDSLMDDPLMGYSSNRYGTVDRHHMGTESRTNSLTAARLDELQYGNGPPPPLNGPNPAYQRRTSQSPGAPYSPQMGRGNGRPSPPNGYMGPASGRPSPPGGMRQNGPYPPPPGQRTPIALQQVDQYAGVSALHPPKGPMNVRSLTGSASASAGSGDSANIDSEPSAHSSQSSLGPRPPMGVR